MKTKTKQIAQTAIMIALLITLQWVTKPLGQFVTGSCVNLILAVSALVGGLWCGIIVAALSPFFAFLVGVGPALFPVVPAVSLGNMALVLLLYFLLKDKITPAKSVLAIGLGAIGKFLTLYLLIVKILLPLLSVPDAAAAALSASFSWPQLITATIGSSVAIAMVPAIKKALKK